MYTEINMEMKKEILMKVQSPTVTSKIKKRKKPKIFKWFDELCGVPALCEV
jgi:hypothetical protein